jgi:hypothetical protein
VCGTDSVEHRVLLCMITVQFPEPLCFTQLFSCRYLTGRRDKLKAEIQAMRDNEDRKYVVSTHRDYSLNSHRHSLNLTTTRAYPCRIQWSQHPPVTLLLNNPSAASHDYPSSSVCSLYSQLVTCTLAHLLVEPLLTRRPL